MSDELILGIDGGGTKVLIALADRTGRIVRSFRGRGVNPMDNSQWQHELEQYLLPFSNEPGLMAVAAALPAYGEVARLSKLQHNVIERVFPNVRHQILNDVDAAHLGAFAGQPGILILSGTGSMAWARNARGESARTGGWGDVIGDEGSSHWIGQRALNLVSQSLDGRASETALAKAMLGQLGIDAADPMNGLGDWASSLSNPRAQIAAVATLVDQLAQQGDEGATGLLEQAADELAKHHRAISRHCGPLTPWTYAGGTFSSRILLKALEHRIGVPPVPPRLSPIGGALLVAAELLDWPVDENWFAQIATAANLDGARPSQN